MTVWQTCLEYHIVSRGVEGFIVLFGLWLIAQAIREP